MAIQVVQQPASVSFAGDPIIVKVKTTLTGKTFLRVKLTCRAEAYRSGAVSAYVEEFSYNVASDGVAVFNVSGTVKTALARCIEQEVNGSTVSQTMYAARFTLTFSEAFLEDGAEIEQGETVSEEYKALPGKLSEYERIIAASQDTSSIIGSGRILSRKPDGERVAKGVTLYVPAVSTASDTVSFSVVQGSTSNSYSQYTGGALVPVSLAVQTSALSVGELKVNTSAETGKRKYIVEPENDMVHFLFVNGFGLVESVTAFTRESLSFSMESEQYVIPSEIGFRSHTRVASYADPPAGKMEMSSGFVDRQWAEWWVNEFMVTERAWMRVNGRFIPVAVMPDDNPVIYSRSEPELISVNFTVRYSFLGGTLNSFV